MAHAKPYVPKRSFSADAIDNIAGRSPVNVDAIDDELKSLSESVNTSIDNQKKIQRDDGKIADGVVDVHTLSQSVLNLIGNFRFRGVWSADVQYLVGDIVSHDDRLYYAAQNHYSSLFTAEPWILFGKDLSVDIGRAQQSADSAKSLLLYNPINNATYKNFVFVGDSLTELRYGTSYLQYMVDELALKNRGYKQIGYVPISQYMTKLKSDIVVLFSGMTQMWGISDGKWGDAPYTYSPDGKGAFTNSALATDYIAFNFTNGLKHSKAKIYYLEQPEGGAFQVGYQNSPSNCYISVNSNGATYALKSIEIDARPEETYNLRIKNFSPGSKIAVFGVEFLSTENNGFTYADFSRNGATLLGFCMLKETSQYFSSIAPDTVLINIGTNDANAMTPSAVFKSSLDEYIGKIKLGAPNAKIVILEPNQPSYYANNPLFAEYTAARKALAAEKGYDYINVPELVGDYDWMAAAGYAEDNTHPNGGGKKKIARAILSALNIVATNTHDTFPKENRAPTIQHKLKSMNVGGATSGQPKLIRSIGLNGNTVVSIIKIEAIIALTATIFHLRISFNAYKQSSDTRGRLSEVRDVVVETLYKSIGASGLSVEASVSVNASTGMAEVYITPIGFSPSQIGVFGDAYCAVPIIDGCLVREA